MITHGMNLDQVRLFAEQLTHRAEEMKATAAELGSTLAGAAWSGPDADAFRGEWEGNYQVALHQIADSLTEAGARAAAHAAEQEEVSSR